MQKIPYNIADRRADYTNWRDWMTFDTAWTMLRRGGYDGLGIVLDRRLGIVGYDADSCISNGAISEAARQHIGILNTYTEESLSGTGIHCLAYGTLPAKGRRSDGFEMYSDRRFFVVTGRHVSGTPSRIEHRQAEIDAVHAAIFGTTSARKILGVPPKSVTQFRGNTQWGEVGVGVEGETCGYASPSVTQFPGNTQGGGGGSCRTTDSPPSRSDEQVLRLLLRDPRAWRYFLTGAGDMNPSRADFALACKLAFYTGGNLQQMVRLFMQSALADRAKCHTTRGDVDYVHYTLQRCLSRQKIYWTPAVKILKPKRPVGRPVSKMTADILTARRQCPTARPCDIARMLAVKPATVRKALSRYSSQSGAAEVRQAEGA